MEKEKGKEEGKEGEKKKKIEKKNETYKQPPPLLVVPPYSQFPFPIPPQFQKASQSNQERSEQHDRTGKPPHPLEIPLHIPHIAAATAARLPPRRRRHGIADQGAKCSDGETHSDACPIFRRMVGQVGDDGRGEGYHAAGNEPVRDGEAEQAGKVVGVVPEKYYQGGKEAAGDHDDHSTDAVHAQLLICISGS